MKTKTLLALFAACSSLAFLPGCASTPHEKPSLTKEQILLQPDVKDHAPTVFAKNVEEVRLAGLRALTFVGCEINIREPFYLAGLRPNKFGLFVGSGGETVKLFLYPQSETETHVWADTDLSFVGIAGQQAWNKQVLEQLTQLLANQAATNK